MKELQMHYRVPNSDSSVITRELQSLKAKSVAFYKDNRLKPSGLQIALDI